MVRMDFAEEPRRGRKLLQPRHLSGRSRPSQLSPPGSPSQLEVTLPEMALGSLAYHFLSLLQTLEPLGPCCHVDASVHPSPSGSEGGLLSSVHITHVVIMAYHWPGPGLILQIAFPFFR